MLSPVLSYQIQPSQPEAHLFTVRCTVAVPNSKGQSFRLPTWVPGSYLIREYAQHVTRFEASTLQGEPLAVEKTDKCTWRCVPCDSAIQISYDVYAWDLSVRGAHLDTFHAYFNGACVFMQVIGQEQQACDVELMAPEGEQYSDWRVGTSFREKTAERYSFGGYQAENYDDLIDHPVEMGDFSVDSFDVAGVPHDLIISGTHWADRERMCEDLSKICQGHLQMFGEFPPMPRYVFLVSASGLNDGGLEHRHSCSLFCQRKLFPRKGELNVSENYLRFLGLCSHEYFHAWHVKRIKPSVFLPYKLDKEAYTRQLWVFEGITSYYDDLNLLRSGLISLDRYLRLIAKTITHVHRGQGRLKQSVAESSFDTWIKAYRPNENSPNATVSYYAKGSLIAFALDLMLRCDSDINLNEVMTEAWERYGKPLIGMPEEGLQKLIEELSGLDLSDFFRRYVYGCEDLPLAKMFDSIGVEHQFQPAVNADDMGGGQWLSEKQQGQRAVLGIRLSKKNRRSVIAHVYEGSPAQKAGLAGKDELLAIAGIKITQQNFDPIINRFVVGDQVEIHAFRGDILRVFKLSFEAAPADTCVLRVKQTVSKQDMQHRQCWLASLCP